MTIDLTTHKPDRTFKYAKHVYLDNVERDWRIGLDPEFDTSDPNQFDPHNAVRVERTSHDQLDILTTGNKHLRFVFDAKHGTGRPEVAK